MHCWPIGCLTLGESGIAKNQTRCARLPFHATLDIGRLTIADLSSHRFSVVADWASAAHSFAP